MQLFQDVSLLQISVNFVLIYSNTDMFWTSARDNVPATKLCQQHFKSSPLHWKWRSYTVRHSPLKVQWVLKQTIICY